jgi:beta-phosphoglucomutase
LISAKTEAFARVVQNGVQPYPNAVELIEQAADAIPIAIVSGALRCDIDLILSGIGDGKLIERFTTVVTADRVTASKPDPASYRMAVDELAVQPATCLAIEDTVAGIASAKAAGLATLGVGHTHPSSTLTAADRVVDQLAQVNLPALHEWFDQPTP